ncbi:DUF364 domain-containing protein [bacterium]|nr:DUF364 domain-containing protein [bacterium]
MDTITGFDKKILKVVTDIPEDIIIEDVRIGLGYICVKNSMLRFGLGYSFHRNWQGSCSFLINEKPLRGMPLKDLIMEFMKTEDDLKRGVAIAALNSYYNLLGKLSDKTDGDPISLLELTKNDVVGMAGFFGPFVPKIIDSAKHLHIVEKKRLDPMNHVSIHKESHILEKCSVVILTATSIINRTIDNLLYHCHNARKVLLVGPSAPLITSLFEDTPVNLLSGMIIKDGNEVSRVVSEGGGTRMFSKFTRKVNLEIGSAGA